MKQQRGEALKKLLRQKQKGFDCWTSRAVPRGSGSFCVPGRAAREPCKHLLLAGKVRNHQKPLPWSNIVVQPDEFFQYTWLLMIFLIHFSKNCLSHGIQAPAWLWIPNWKWIPAWLIPRASAESSESTKQRLSGFLHCLLSKTSTKSCTNTAQQQIQSHWAFRRGSGK